MRFREIIKQCITRYTARRSLFCCNEAKNKAMQKRYFHQRKTLKSMFILRSLIIYVMHINNNNAEEACNEVTSCIYYICAHAKLLFSKMLSEVVECLCILLLQNNAIHVNQLETIIYILQIHRMAYL